jgi:cytochrome c2
MKRALLIGLALVFTLATIGSTAALAEDAGATLLDQRCSVCHPSARPKAAKKTPEQWEATVTRMMGKGAKLSVEEKKLLLDHLSKTYKP